MTLVITHAQGFLGCFTLEADGSLRQRALIDTGSESPSPQELAEVGTDLAKEYGWSLNGASVKKVAQSGKKVAAPVKKVAQPVKKALPPGEVSPIKQRIRQYLTNHPDSSIKDLILASGEPFNETIKSRWTFHLLEMVKQGQLLKKKNAGPLGMNLYRLNSDLQSVPQG